MKPCAEQIVLFRSLHAVHGVSTVQTHLNGKSSSSAVRRRKWTPVSSAPTAALGSNICSLACALPGGILSLLLPEEHLLWLVASALIRETMHNFLQDVACIVDSMCCHSHYRQQACLHCSRHTLLVVCSGSFDFEEEQDLAIDELQDEQQQQQQQPSPGAAVFITSLRGCVYLCWLWYLHCLLTCMSSAPTKSSRCCTWGLGGDLSLLCLITVPQFSLNLGHKIELPLQSANWLTYLCEFCRGLEPQAVPQRNGRAKCSGERRCLLEACVI